MWKSSSSFIAQSYQLKSRINSASGLEKTVRVMFDDGSEKTWIRKGLADEPRLDGAKETVVVATFRQIG